MKIILRVHIPRCFLIFFLLVGCSSDDPATETPKDLTFEEVEKAFSELDVQTGINDFSLEVPGNLSWDFRVIAPDVSDGDKKPLFVHLHGAAGGIPMPISPPHVT